MPDLDAWANIAEHAAQHHGVVSSSLAKDVHGVTASQLNWFERSGRLKRVASGAYVLVGSTPTWRQRAMVAVVSSQGWLSHKAAAALWGLDGFEFRRIDVLTPFGRRPKARPWRVHQTRRLRSVDLLTVDNIPCTAVPRTVIDLAAVAHPYELTKALDDACRRWPGMLDRITARFVELAGRGRRGSKLLREMLEERRGERFTQTGFEETARRLVLSVGLPPPVPQCRVSDDLGPMYLDLGWPEVLWAIECDSLAWHSGKHAHEGDRLRRRRLKALGWDVVEVTFADVTKRAVQTGEQLRALYQLRVEAMRALNAYAQEESSCTDLDT